MNHPVCAEQDCLYMALVILFFLFVSRASAMEVLLTTQQPFILDNNTTLVIEDVNSQQGVIWLKLYCKLDAIDSAVIRLGEHLKYAGKNITFYNIYSGGDSDLVALKIKNETTDASRTGDNNRANIITANIITAGIFFNNSHKQAIEGNASQRSMAVPVGSLSQRYLPFV